MRHYSRFCVLVIFCLMTLACATSYLWKIELPLDEDIDGALHLTSTGQLLLATQAVDALSVYEVDLEGHLDLIHRVPVDSFTSRLFWLDDQYLIASNGKTLYFVESTTQSSWNLHHTAFEAFTGMFPHDMFLADVTWLPNGNLLAHVLVTGRTSEGWPYQTRHFDVFAEISLQGHVVFANAEPRLGDQITYLHNLLGTLPDGYVTATVATADAFYGPIYSTTVQRFNESHAKTWEKILAPEQQVVWVGEDGYVQVDESDTLRTATYFDWSNTALAQWSLSFPPRKVELASDGVLVFTRHSQIAGFRLTGEQVFNLDTFDTSIELNRYNPAGFIEQAVEEYKVSQGGVVLDTHYDPMSGFTDGKLTGLTKITHMPRYRRLDSAGTEIKSITQSGMAMYVDASDYDNLIDVNPGIADIVDYRTLPDSSVVIVSKMAHDLSDIEPVGLQVFRYK